MKNNIRYIFYTMILAATAPLFPLVALIDAVTGGSFSKKTYGPSVTH